ncbi:histidinol-phosphatase HisJ family protein [Methylacidimicrobium tartarophylax]|uniref:Histidinol-phosphatase n=1 Tax=Methylacidimicrobium tartarophylax TaxID=1041768 RepID=A0A5E6MHZ9_9BACT|nr:histidinol-phosphatase HisJ family protein [Methylacidimicrobium tartarophylax]VVM05665.1 histidinol-phosphatase (PHP family) [Methylacidimicrobium tartarophylax]
MNIFSDYHMHPQGHRLQPYGRALLEPWSDAARKKGIREFAITDHDRYHAGVDFDSFREWRDRNEDLTIRMGIELDNDPQNSEVGLAWVQRNWEKLDFVLGSVHFLGDWPFDRAGEDVGFSRRPIEEIYREYADALRKLVERGWIDCLAHLDLIKIFGFRPKAGFLGYFEEVLLLARERDLALEISTAGWRKPVGEAYPDEEIIRRAREMGIPITLASDAHSPFQIGEDYERLSLLLKRLGIGEVALFEGHKRKIVPLAAAERL